MNLEQIPGLFLLVSVGLLAWLAFMQRGAKRLEVGTLFIWQRVVARQQARERKVKMEPLLWLLAAALLLGSFAAARPVLAAALPSSAVVAVYLERLSPAQHPGELPEPELEEVLVRAQEVAPGAKLEFYYSGWIDQELLATAGSTRALARGSLAQELAQFQAQSRGADARVLFLCEPSPAANRIGLVLPRVSRARSGVVHQVELRGRRVFVHSSGSASLSVDGAGLLWARLSNGGAVREYEPKAAKMAILAEGTPRIEIVDAPPIQVCSGGQWNSDVHRALLEALVRNSNFVQQDKGRLGFDCDAPSRVEIQRGQPTDLAGAQLSYSSQHRLFAELPLDAFNWLAQNLTLAPDPEWQPLLSATRNGKVIGDLIAISFDSKTIRFAGDPFSLASAGAAALLLDNTIGVLVGSRPSENVRLRIAQGANLPTERAAYAAPFDPQGTLDVSSAGAPRPFELAHLFAIASAALALFAAWLTR